MDTDINNYSIDEIFSIIKVDKDCKLEQLYDTVKSAMNKIESSDGINTYEYKHFFRECFKKIVMKQGLNVPDYIYKDLGIIKLDAKIPDVNLVTNTEKDNMIVHSKNYPGAVPEYIPNDMTVNTSTTRYPRGTVNPIKRETIKNILTINSKFRDDTSELTTDFSVDLNDVYHNVVSMKLASLEFMNSYYTFSTYLKTNEFTVSVFEYNTTTNAITTGPVTTRLEFSEGNYNAFEIAVVLNNVFTSAPVGSFIDAIEADYNTTKGKLFFRVRTAGAPPLPSGAGHAWGFDLDFTVIEDCKSRELYNNFGWLAGFRDDKYLFFENYKQTATTEFEVGYNPEAFLNLIGSHYYLLEVTDYNKNVSEVLKYNTSHIYSFNIHDVLAKVPNVAGQLDVLFEDSSDRIFKTRQYFGPVKINKLHIRLLDEDGRTLNLNDGDITLSLEIEQLDAPYKNMVQ